MLLQNRTRIPPTCSPDGGLPCCSGAWRWRRPRARFRTKPWSFSTGYLIDHSPRPSLRALSPDGKPLYIGGPETNQIDDVAMAIDTANGTQVWDLDPLGMWGESTGSSPALSPDGKTLGPSPRVGRSSPRPGFPRTARRCTPLQWIRASTPSTWLPAGWCGNCRRTTISNHPPGPLCGRQEPLHR